MMEYRALRDSTEHLGDIGRLSENLAEDGYLLLRRLLDPQRVQQVKRDIMGVLHETHIIEGKDTEDPMWSGGPHPSEAEHMRYYDKIVRLDSFNRLAESPEIVAVMEGMIGEAVTVWKQRLIRVMFPDPDAAEDVGVGTHQDGAKNLGYQADRFYTCWLPLMDIDPNIGGLAIALGSHKMGFLEHAGSSPSDAKKARSKGFGLDSTEFAWGTSDYHPGDAIFFGHVTAHRGLVNRSDRIRLSCDFRYQSVKDTVNWIAHTPGPDVRRVAQKIDAVITSRALYVTTHADKETLQEVRRIMLEEKSTSLERAQELAAEVGRRNQPVS
jgi:ectoine hydroxylase-related dioxygenase (phytanoyl-CoA dioxygenase family)